MARAGLGSQVYVCIQWGRTPKSGDVSLIHS